MRKYLLVCFVFVFVRLWALEWENLPFLQNIESIRLSNGLVVYFQRDVSTPLVFVSVVYKVGFHNEMTNQRGYTHLLEHMMFKGSPRYPKGFLHQIYGQEGIRYNAYTGHDMTLYYGFGSVASLEVILAVEADRMRDLLFDRQEFEREKKVVADELSGYEASPSFQLEMAMMEKFLPQDAFRWGPGRAKDILNASYDEVVKLYRTYYVPNNAFMVVIGNVEKERLVRLMEKYFSSIPANPHLPKEMVASVSFQPGQVVSLSGPSEDSFGRLFFGLPGFSYTNRDILLAYLVVDGGLVRGMKADFGLDATLLSLTYERSPFFPGRDIDKKYVESELKKARETLYHRYRLQKNDIEERGMILSSFLRYGEVYDIKRWMGLLDSVTADEVYDFMRRVLVSTNALSGYFTATKFDQRRRVLSVNFQTVENFESASRTYGFAEIDQKTLQARHEELYKDILHYQREFFRDVRRYQLSNGMVILVKPFSGQGMVSFAWEFRDDAPRQKKPYQLAFMQWYVREGGPHYTLRKQLEAKGAWGSEYSVNVYAADWKKAVEYIARMYTSRRFSPLVLEEMKEQYILRYKENKSNPSPSYHIGNLVDKQLFQEFVYQDRVATPADILSLQVKDIEEIYYALVRPENMVISVVGDVDEKELISTMEKTFSSWNPPLSSLKPQTTVFKKEQKQKVFEMAVPGEQGIGIIAGKWGISYTNERQWVQGLLLNTIFGEGGFSSRLMEDIRENQGLTYHIESDLSLPSFRVGEALFVCEFTTFKEKVEDILVMYQRKLKAFQEAGPKEEELLQHKMRTYAEEVFGFRSFETIASRLAYNEACRGRYDYTLVFLRYVYETNREELRKLIPVAFPIGKETIVIGK